MDLSEELRATGGTSIQCLTIYIPDRDRHSNELGDQRRWVLEGAQLLAEIGGGVTILPPSEGGWLSGSGAIVWEKPVLIYTFIKPDAFRRSIPKLRDFLHRLGRDTNQGEVAFEFDGRFYRVIEFDPPEKQ